MEAAFFDVDKTIIAKSAVLAFGGPMYREGLVTKRMILHGAYGHIIYSLLGANEARMEKMRKAVSGYTKGWDQSSVRQLVAEFAEAAYTPIIYREALELIDEHQQAGRMTVIVSSAPEDVVMPLGEMLGVDHIIATRSLLDEEGRYSGELDFWAHGPHKAEAMQRLAKKEGIDLDQSYAYSDSITDLPMLEVVGHPVAVNADRDLHRIARERGWERRTFAKPVRLRDRAPVPTKKVGIIVAAVAAGLVGGAIAYSVLSRRRRR